MRLDNTLLDIDTLLSELDKEISVSKSAHKAQPNALEILQRKIKDNYFQDNTRPKDKKMKPEEVLNHLNSPAFLDFPRLKYVIHEIFKGNQNIQIPEELKDWEPTVSFESLNEKYGYFDTDLSDLFARLAIACRKMTAIIERQANDDEMAYKLMALFYDPNKTNDENFQSISTKFDSIITKKQDKSIAHPYHDAFVTILHHFPIFSAVKDLQSWQAFIAKEGFKALNIFAQCAHLQPAFENIKEAQDFLLKQKYPRANEHPELAKLCKKLLIDNAGFEAGLNEVKTGWPKKNNRQLTSRGYFRCNWPIFLGEASTTRYASPVSWQSHSWLLSTYWWSF